MAEPTSTDTATRTSTRKRATSTAQEPANDGATSPAPQVTVTALLSRPLDENSRELMVCEAAYYRAERRGFAAGHELEDWLAAESEIDAFLQRVYGESRTF